LFNNCEKIKDLFNKINEDIVKRPYNFSCYDQPYIVYNAFKYNLYNNNILKTLAVNNDNNIHSDKVIHHFPGYPGRYEHKITTMTIFLNNIKKLIITIPKILFQTNKISNDTYVLNMIKDKLGSDWKYEFYNDENVINFTAKMRLLEEAVKTGTLNINNEINNYNNNKSDSGIWLNGLIALKPESENKKLSTLYYKAARK
jgi:hypothetical protein